MLILGLNLYHADSAACLLRDGEIIAAVEEERFCRRKHWAGFPARSVGYCLQAAGASLADVDHIAVNSDPRAQLARKLWYVTRGRARWSLLKEKIRTRVRRRGVTEQLEHALSGQRFSGSVHRVEHHLAHLSSCFYASSFNRAVVASVDGFGDFTSCAWATGEHGQLRRRAQVLFPHSLGVFYEAMTQYLGFEHYGDEYKLMGLAAHGKPDSTLGMDALLHAEREGLFSLNLDFFRHHRHPIGYEWDGAEPQVSRLFSARLEHLLGPRRRPHETITARHADIAATTQALYERALFRLLNAAAEATGADHLCLAGGCAQNSVANGKIRTHTPYRRVFVQPAAGDGGGALGAAWHVWHRQSDCRRATAMPHSYWGPEYSRDQIQHYLEDDRGRLAQAGCTINEIDDRHELCARVAAHLDAGRIVGWFQGRMEWGPRALGNRSILADPRRADMRQHLNGMIKRREDFRPFAPAILRSAVCEWFDVDIAVPFMTEVYAVRNDKRCVIPAVVHKDGTGRLQTVTRDTNPLFYTLIEAFAARSGIPILLNTSFNEREPIVCSPAEALDCFLRTGMDVLAVGPFVVETEGAQQVK